MEIKQLSLGMVNAYLISEGKDSFLVDTGLAMSRKKLIELLSGQGVRPEKIRLVMLTHGDPDHSGNCAYFQKMGAKIAVHEKDAEMCRTGKMNTDRKRKANWLSRLVGWLMFKAVFRIVMRLHPFETFQPDIILSDGQDMKPFGFDAKIVHVPGHTPGSIGILTKDNDFFSGDTINNRKKPETADIIEDEAALEKSLERIRKLKIGEVYPGHGTPFAMPELHL